ncbi:response regulator [Xinfangfangia pollutisoli]|uniref:response regulator n=1 Tax=Xinfangfangia pollutisoli TaxID=2865960 RepID=UPI00296EAE53|nr:response regulator [Xinfangfangia pollutisoli]
MTSLKRNLPPLTSLVSFEAAARLGSFSDAARELNVTREAVSRQIRALETHLGLSLFERNANGTTLRSWGRQYFETVTASLETIARASQLGPGGAGPDPEAADPDADPVEDDRRPRLLIVDDVPENIRRLHDALRDSYEIIAHLSASDALDWLAAGGQADLAMLDVCMSGMDGYALCRRIKADPRNAAMPVIFLTSLDAPQDETQGFAAGACDFISRPFVPAVLRARIDVQLELRRTTAALETLLERRADRLERAEALIAAIRAQIDGYG